MPALDQKVALITGAKGGLGNFVTEAFLEAGLTKGSVPIAEKDVSALLEPVDYIGRIRQIGLERDLDEAARRLAVWPTK